MSNLRRQDDEQMQSLEEAVKALTLEVGVLSVAVKDQSKAFKDHEKKTAPMYEWFQNINFTKRSIMWVLGILSAIGGLILMYKEILK